MIVGSTRAVPVIINEVSLSSLPLPLLSSPGEETQCTLNILLSSLSPVVVAGAVVHITVNGFGGAAVGGAAAAAAVIFLHFSFQTASELERPSAVPRQLHAGVSRTDPIQRSSDPSEKIGHHAISERGSTPSSSSVFRQHQPMGTNQCSFAPSVRRTGCGCLVNGFEKKSSFNNSISKRALPRRVVCLTERPFCGKCS